MRHTLTVLVLALLAGLIQLFAAPSAGACPHTVVIGVDGTGSVGHTPSLVTQHADPWIAEGAEFRRIDYPGSIWPIGPYPYDQSRRAGIDATKAEINAVRRECPDAHIHLVGHSQGAAVIGDALEERTAAGESNTNISADLYADPRHPDTGIEVVLPGLLPGYSMKNERGSMGEAKVYQQCVQGDPVCDFPQPLQDPLGLIDAPAGYWYKHGYHLPDSPEPRSGTHVIPAGPMTPFIPPVEQRQIPFAPDLRDVIDYQVPALPDVPPLPNLTEPYVERPLSVYVPDHVEPYVPAPILDHVPPPLPQLPPLPVIELPQLPALPPLPALPAL
ncbi:PE-PPE domain-containing protein [Rhodococcus ruber]|uniref:cutinase family protein n=1 Tax=Rhodococcus ruber TaxID=1830 RepID=UPI0022B51BFC|nr:PE-PPE domain-containing protein [Rhodococcus ruber]MCZ4505911.1 PE-PPE domain-containing protein [Rhodococcus ruber]